MPGKLLTYAACPGMSIYNVPFHFQNDSIWTINYIVILFHIIEVWHL